MEADSSREPGSFWALSGRLLRATFPTWSDTAVDQYLERAVARIRRAAGTEPAPPRVAAADLVFGLLGQPGVCIADLFGVDLHEMDLSGAQLSEADFSGADLSRADLSGADLSEANLSRADLSEAHIVGTTLVRANLSRAFLINADLTEANLAGALLGRRTVLHGACLSGADLMGTHLAGANLAKASLVGANLAKADLTGANLTKANLADARWDTDTRWPAPAVRWISARSERLPSGGFRIVAESATVDRATTRVG